MGVCFFWGGVGQNDAKSASFRPFVDFLRIVGGFINENLIPPYFGRGQIKNQGFGLI